mgnify:CR=1 FL=1
MIIPNPRIRLLTQAMIRDDLSKVDLFLHGNSDKYDGEFKTVYKSYEPLEVEIAYHLMLLHNNNISMCEQLDDDLEYFNEFRERILSRNDINVDRDLNYVNDRLIDIQKLKSAIQHKIYLFEQFYLIDETLNLISKDDFPNEEIVL